MRLLTWIIPKLNFVFKLCTLFLLTTLTLICVGPICLIFVIVTAVNHLYILILYLLVGGVPDGIWTKTPTTVWTPTDLHSATTVAATGVDPLDPEFADLRSTIGKKVNFAKNYGAQRKKIRALFPFQTEDEITRINDAYYLTFPGVKTYHQYCYGRASFPIY